MASRLQQLFFRDLPTSKDYSFNADVIRAVAIIGVVLIHLVYPIYGRTDFFGGGAWWLATVLNAFSRVAIPLFIMLSGYFILPKNESWPQLRRRIWHRLAIPLLAWSAFYFWWDYYYLSKEHGAWEIVSTFFVSNIFHLYFLVILIGLYLAVPLIQKLLAGTKTSFFRPLLGFSFFAGSIIYLAPYILTRDQTQVNSFTIWLPFLGYFLVGYSAAKLRDKKKKIDSAGKLALLFALSFVMTLMLSYTNVYAKLKNVWVFWRASGVSYFDEYLSPNVVIMSVALFFFLLENEWLTRIGRNRFVRAAVHNLARVSFALYLVHFWVLNILDFRYRFAIEFFEGGSVLQYFLVRSALALAGSWLVANVLVRIPLLKKTVGEK